jgi:glutamate racemase
MSNSEAQAAIGVFDSGVGGLTVARAVLEQLPAEQLVYLGDTARVPYGARSPQTVLRYSRHATRFLLAQSVKLVLIACNTASASALESLRAEVAVPVLGAVEPGALAAARTSQSGVVGVIGTLGTVRSGAYERALHALRPELRVYAVPCPLLVPIVEEGWIAADDAVSQLVVRRYLAPLRQQAPDLDTLVLGCTHYPLLRPVIAEVAAALWAHPVTLVDSALAMAEATQQILADLGLLAPSPPAPLLPSARLSCYVTDEARVAEVATRFLGHPLGNLHLIDL